LNDNLYTMSDLATDYDIFDPQFVADPYSVYRELRETCAIAHTERYGGSWLPTTYDDLHAMAHDVETFSSRKILVVPPPPSPVAGDDPNAAIGAPPISSDPPEHQWARRLILPFFAPKAVEKYGPTTRELCHRLIDGFVDRGRADIATDYAQQIPVRVIARMLGVDPEQSDTFVAWVRAILEQGHADPERRMKARDQLIAFFVAEIADRRLRPRQDLISYLVEARVEGRPVSDRHIIGTCNLILIAGIDTTWSAIGSTLWYLAQHPEDRRRLRTEPDLWMTALEEFLRAFSPVTMAREATRDIDYKGCPIKTGDRVLMPFPAANRDPAMFERPDEVVLDRQQNRHIAFGTGIHRCAGSNLARLELRIAVETFLERIPDFELVDPEAVTWAGGQVHGPRVCEVRFPTAHCE
jgi:cytochrome P450